MVNTVKQPSEVLRDISQEIAIPIDSVEFSKYLDGNDDIAEYRSKFHYPKNKTISKVDLDLVDGNDECIYFCGNSLGLCPKTAHGLIDREMKKWEECGVLGHHEGSTPWEKIGEDITYQAAEIVGAKPDEVVLMNALTVNLHLLMVSFYKPTPGRNKIIIEKDAFPSDVAAVVSQISFHGYDPKSSLITIGPENGESILRTENIISEIEEVGDEVALIMFSGVQFCSGQYFDLEAITAAGHRKGCKVGFDLAHAVGNVEMKLHAWNVDFACWCSYKYLNGGPGSISGAFVHEKYRHDRTIKRFEGWWGIDFEKRFQMDNDDILFLPGAMGYAISNPPVMSTLPVLASLEIFHSVGMTKITKKQFLLTGFLEHLLLSRFDSSILRILTPADSNSRGCQLSVKFTFNLNSVFQGIRKRGVVCDMRRGNVLRLAPCPLYNKFSDVYKFVQVLEEVISCEIK